MKTNKFLLWLFVVTIINSSNSENYKEFYIEKIYVPIKINKSEVDLKFVNAGVRGEINSNHIENDESEVWQLLGSASNATTDKMTTTNRPSAFPFHKRPNTIDGIHDDDNHDHSTPKSKSIVDVFDQSTSEEVKESTNQSNFTTSRNRDDQENKRIPPPSASTTNTLRLCEIKYAEYIQRIFPQESDTATDANDVDFNGRILAAPGEYPHMTAVGFRSSDGSMDYKCGGSLISESFVITAAHCANFGGLQPSKVRIGDLNLMIEESYLEPQLRAIKNIFVHPDYKPTSYYNDIALLELEKEVQLTEFVRPIRLWIKESLPFNTAYAMGYGSTDFARERTNRLTNLNMTIVPNDECNREMARLPEAENSILPSQICAKDYALNRDTCQGDSGGPLQLNIRGNRRKSRVHYHLIGITSYGIYCRSGYPSIYTRVCFYLDWIERIVWKDYFD